MFRTSYFHHQEYYIVHAALYGTFFMHLYKLMLNRQNKYIKYKNIKEKMYKTNTAMWCNKTCRQKI